MEAAKGTNLFFAVYEATQQDITSGRAMRKRSFSSIPLNNVISRQKKGLPPAPEDRNGDKLLFVLSPNDLVYLPTDEEIRDGHIIAPINKERIYKMVSCTGNRAFFVPFAVASVIVDKLEFTSQNKIELFNDKISIKEICIPLMVDRLGNVKYNNLII